MVKRVTGVRKEARATKFAELVLRGYTYIQAWREVTPDWAEKAPDSHYVRASELANQPLTKRKIDELQKNARLESIDNHIKYHADLLQQIEDAKLAKNWNAVGGLMRTRGMSGAWLQDKSTLTIEHRVEAEKLREQLKSLGMPADQVDSFVVKTNFGETKH